MADVIVIEGRVGGTNEATVQPQGTFNPEDLTVERILASDDGTFQLHPARFEQMIRTLANRSGSQIHEIPDPGEKYPCPSCGKVHTGAGVDIESKFTPNGATIAALGCSYEEANAILDIRLHRMVHRIMGREEIMSVLIDVYSLGIQVGIAAGKATEEEVKRAQGLSGKAAELYTVIQTQKKREEEEGAKQRIC